MLQLLSPVGFLRIPHFVDYMASLWDSSNHLHTIACIKLFRVCCWMFIQEVLLERKDKTGAQKSAKYFKLLIYILYWLCVLVLGYFLSDVYFRFKYRSCLFVLYTLNSYCFLLFCTMSCMLNVWNFLLHSMAWHCAKLAHIRKSTCSFSTLLIIQHMCWFNTHFNLAHVWSAKTEDIGLAHFYVLE